jgi:hypothetical protein
MKVAHRRKRRCYENTSYIKVLLSRAILNNGRSCFPTTVTGSGTFSCEMARASSEAADSSISNTAGILVGASPRFKFNWLNRYRVGRDSTHLIQKLGDARAYGIRTILPKAPGSKISL